jgi:tRNA(adenine34) deaminase
MKSSKKDDLYFMGLALAEAGKALKKGEVPIGAVLVKGDKVIARGHNLKESKQDTTNHAELEVIRKASKKLKNWRLTETTLYSTVEPCVMCAAAIAHARISKVVFGCYDHKFGGYGSLVNVNELKTNHRLELVPEFQAEAAAKLLKEFFKYRRQTKDTTK